VGGPFKVESKPYIITVDNKGIIAAIDNTINTGTTKSAVEVTPEATIGEVEIPTTDSRDGNWIPVSVIVAITVMAAGLANYKKRVTI
jgi:hypothetical protein